MKKRHHLTIYFGLPGSGKTTIASSLAIKDLRRGRNVFSNCPINGCYEITSSDLGTFMIKDARVIIDEAGVEFDNRKFKLFTDSQTYFFKYYRHAGLDIDVFSQSYGDMDKKIRDLADRLYIVRKSLIPFHISAVRINRNCASINDLTKEICDGYSYDPFILRLFTTRRIFAPFYWYYFNSYSYKHLPRKVFKNYGGNIKKSSWLKRLFHLS